MESKTKDLSSSGLKPVFGKEVDFHHYVKFDDPKLDKNYLKNPLSYESALELCGFNNSNP
jgi:hypothetical protein